MDVCRHTGYTARIYSWPYVTDVNRQGITDVERITYSLSGKVRIRDIEKVLEIF